MEITTGFIMLAAGIGGAALCLILLLITIPIFKKQRRRLLERLQDM